MKKLLTALVVCLVSVVAHAEYFTPSCSGNDGVSYVQGEVSSNPNGSATVVLDGYGQYINCSAVLIVYSKDYNGNEHEWYRKYIKISNGTSGKINLSSIKGASRVDVQVSSTCR